MRSSPHALLALFLLATGGPLCALSVDEIAGVWQFELADYRQKLRDQPAPVKPPEPASQEEAMQQAMQAAIAASMEMNANLRITFAADGISAGLCTDASKTQTTLGAFASTGAKTATYTNADGRIITLELKEEGQLTMAEPNQKNPAKTDKEVLVRVPAAPGAGPTGK